MSRNVSGVRRTTTTRIASRTPYNSSGRGTLSASRPPPHEPIAIPPKNPVRITEIACVVLPKTSTSCRDQTTSYMRPAAPDRMKMARIGQRRDVTGGGRSSAIAARSLLGSIHDISLLDGARTCSFASKAEAVALESRREEDRVPVLRALVGVAVFAGALGRRGPHPVDRAR